MIRFLSALALCIGFQHSALAVEVLRWERLPLAVRLLVGQERVVFMDRNVRVGLPATGSEALSVQSAGGALYLKAVAPLGILRLQVQDADTGAVVLLDVSAESASPNEPPLEPIRIVTNITGPATTLDDAALEATRRTTTPAAVLLTRYAAQSLYAPLRTVTPVPGVTAVAVQSGLQLETLIPTAPVSARALAAWRLGDHWVTAIKLTNSADHTILLDPRELQGAFVAATFQHPTVGPAGDSTDTTVVYVVTRGYGIAGNLLPALAPFDASTSAPLVVEPAHEE